MSGVFGRLQDHMDKDNSNRGISPLDLANLPADQRAVVRMMLREVEMTYDQLVTAMQNNHSDISLDALHDAFETLSKEGWLIKMGVEKISYRVNLRRKGGSTLSSSIWSALGSRIDDSKTQAVEPSDNDENDATNG